MSAVPVRIAAVTAKLDLCVRPASGLAPALVQALIPAGAFGSHGSEQGAGSTPALLCFRLVGENQYTLGQQMLEELSSSPLVAEAFLRQLNVGRPPRVRK